MGKTSIGARSFQAAGFWIAVIAPPYLAIEANGRSENSPVYKDQSSKKGFIQSHWSFHTVGTRSSASSAAKIAAIAALSASSRLSNMKGTTQ